MDELIFIENLKERVLTLNKTIWENKVSCEKIDYWLENFNLDDEKNMALYLLSEFMYFGDVQMKVLLRTLYRDLFRYPIIKKIRLENANTLNHEFIEKEYNAILKNTRFMGIGNPAESGAHLLYFFRQENKLSKKYFINSYEIDDIENKEVNRIVFLDDFCGSGNQVQTDKALSSFIEYLREAKSGIELYYLMLVGTSLGIKNVTDTGMFQNVTSVIKLDNSFKCFDTNSRYFNNITPYFFSKEDAKIFSIKYGKELMKDYWLKYGLEDVTKIDSLSTKSALGFGDCQLLLGFNHNTPNNTLPIIWYDEEDYNWTPIFKRYNKKYNF
jgi:hypothetical protein